MIFQGWTVLFESRFRSRDKDAEEFRFFGFFWLLALQLILLVDIGHPPKGIAQR
jgi:hypothetical protein